VLFLFFCEASPNGNTERRRREGNPVECFTALRLGN